jgi:hypothetical protein
MTTSHLVKSGVPHTRIWTLAQVQTWLDTSGSPITTLEEAAHLLASECPREGYTPCTGPFSPQGETVP